MSNIQPGILAPIPTLARHLLFSLKPSAKADHVLTELAAAVDGGTIVVGLGQSLILALGGHIDGLRTFPAHAGAGIVVPSTPAALWCWLRGEDRGDLLHATRRLQALLAPAFQLDQAIDAFQYGESRDLTGYEDGTENPKDDDAVNVAMVDGMGVGLDGSSFVVVQQWVHDLDVFEQMNALAQDDVIGRRKIDNEEIQQAPPSAHVKRTAQESFTPEAFVLRRSMPWMDGDQAGLMFVAFGRSFSPFEAQLRRMAGAEDGIVDALFTFTHPVSGGYFWCPPLRKGQLDLSALTTKPESDNG